MHVVLKPVPRDFHTWNDDDNTARMMAVNQRCSQRNRPFNLERKKKKQTRPKINKPEVHDIYKS
jgi:hypothetical protein